MSRISSTSSREPRCCRGGACRARSRPGRRSARPRRPTAASANVVGRAPVARREAARRSAAAGLHRVHEVVGGVAARRAPVEPCAAQQVAAARPPLRAAAPRARARAPARGRAAVRRQPPQEAGAHVPVAPVTSSIAATSFRIRRGPPSATTRPWKTASSGRSREHPGNCGREKSASICGTGTGERAAIAARMPTRAEDQARHLRGLLLPPEPALRTGAGEALHHVPAGRARTRARAPADLRLPHRARTAAYAFPQPNADPQRCRRRALESLHAAHRPGQVAVLAGRRRGVLGLPRRGRDDARAARLRQRRVRQAARADGLRGRGRGRASRTSTRTTSSTSCRTRTRSPTRRASSRCPCTHWPGTDNPARPALHARRARATPSARWSGAWGNDDLIENAFDLTRVRPASELDIGPLRIRSRRCRTSPRPSR